MAAANGRADILTYLLEHGGSIDRCVVCVRARVLDSVHVHNTNLFCCVHVHNTRSIDGYTYVPGVTEDTVFQARKAFHPSINPRLSCRGWTPLHYATGFKSPSSLYLVPI